MISIFDNSFDGDGIRLVFEIVVQLCFIILFLEKSVFCGMFDYYKIIMIYNILTFNINNYSQTDITL